jgi:hypothetical protein
VRGEQREDVVAVPAGMPELYRDAHPARDPREEVAQPDVVAGPGGRQLHQQHRPAAVQLVPARRGAVQPGLRRLQLARVGQAASTRLIRL